MALKRLLQEGGEGDLELPNKRRHLLSTLFKGASSARTLQDYVPRLEPILRKWVKEEVNRAMDPFLRSSSDGQIESSGSRTLQLQFHSNLPHTLFTGNRIVSEGTSPVKSPVKIALYDSASQRIVTWGPYSSMKVNIIVLCGDFVPDSRDDWSKKDFDSKVVQNREGKRPLLTGELSVSLQDGVGYIGNVSFTDNSSWIRSGKFRLGVKVHSCSDETSIREGISNAFKVKDHRGESYQKHYPPSLEDEVWRLEKIAKDGASHRRLTQFGILCVRDFLRLHATNQLSLRDVLRNISNKKWDTIIGHAITCTLDDKKYIYRTAEGTVLLFNSIYKVVGVTFDGHSYHSVDSLNMYQMKMVEDLKQQAYRNLHDWEDYEAGPNIGPQDANLHVGQGQLEMQMNTHQLKLSLPRGCEVEQDTNSFELGGSSQMQGFNLTFTNSFGMSDSPSRFDIGGHTWASGGGNYMDSQLSPQDFTVDDNFEVESSALIGNVLFLV